MYASIATPAASWQADQTLLTYLVPEDLEDLLQPGQLVAVPYGQRLVEGIIWTLDDDTDLDEELIEDVRPIRSLLDQEPALFPHQLALAEWIADYYLTPLASVATMMLPPGLMRRSQTILQLSESDLPGDSNEGSLRLQALRGLLLQDGEIDLEQLKKLIGPTKTRDLLKELRSDDRFVQDARLAPAKARSRHKRVVELLASTEQIETHLSTLSEKQVAAIELIQTASTPWSVHSLTKASSLTQSQLQQLVQAQIVHIHEIEVRRDPLQGRSLPASQPLTLTTDQAQALEKILDRRKPGKVVLLHGITGSGKTEVYLQAFAQILKEGKQGLMLVPEIALTTQAIQRVASRFPGRVAIIHSELGIGERYDEWRRIRNGEVDIVIGSRSALFAPLARLGMIVIDEEHEPAYKQAERRPTYHARLAALQLGQILKIPVVLGSATPSMESTFYAQEGAYELVTLEKRIGASLPPVEIVDLRVELQAGHTSILSRRLLESLTQVLEQKEQAILFLNRRGSASCVLCRSCGYTALCERCDIPLTYHATEQQLLCHYCGHKEDTLQICPACRSEDIRYFGVGTEKVEATLERLFPKARLLRWDRDTARNRRAHERLLDCFANREADILIGTQMIAKGLDLPDVTLVGAISADIAINLPDFSAAERTFTLLTQVAGRAGRGQKPGHVIIQTFNPEHFCIETASKHDYGEFYRAEIASRERYGYPPFRQFVKLTYSHANRHRCQNEALLLSEHLTEWLERLDLHETDFVGPAPASMERLRGKYRWQIILRGNDLHRLLRVLDTRGWEIDIDPISTM